MSEILYPVKRFFRVNCREAARGGFLQEKKPPAKGGEKDQPLQILVRAQQTAAKFPVRAAARAGLLFPHPVPCGA